MSNEPVIFNGHLHWREARVMGRTLEVGWGRGGGLVEQNI